MNEAEAIARAFAAPGRISLPFTDAIHDPDRPLWLHAYRPAAHTPDRPVVFVLHGLARNGEEYREHWIDTAERHGALILAPGFPEETHPGARAYNDGGVLDAAGEITPSRRWAYQVPARMLALLQRAGVTRRRQAFLYGHSAGAEFAQRMVLLTDRSPFCAVVAANAGWYTLPTLLRPFPEGLGGLGLTDADLEARLAWPLVILAGEADLDATGPSVPSLPAALAQGPNRFARARHLMAFARAEAVRRGTACHWRLETAPGIAHDGHAMSQVCAALWFEGQMPDAARMAALAGKPLR
ncbi:alpha/beta fold hydrolase [Roseomonas rosulenta]|uniref:alpha/beta hydrolase n=1 Tax=Roseomonas rosulenta TaxID=2748667 RepID=UPI0018DF43E7